MERASREKELLLTSCEMAAASESGQELEMTQLLLEQLVNKEGLRTTVSQSVCQQMTTDRTGGT